MKITVDEMIKILHQKAQKVHAFFTHSQRKVSMTTVQTFTKANSKKVKK
jgi:hypothetical protein